MFGFRPEGRQVKEMDPIVKMTPYIMPMRCDAQVFLDYDIEYEPLMRFIAQKYVEAEGQTLSSAMAWMYFLIVILIVAAVAGVFSMFVFYQKRDM
jgi:hypothetical protein